MSSEIVRIPFWLYRELQKVRKAIPGSTIRSLIEEAVLEHYMINKVTGEGE